MKNTFSEYYKLSDSELTSHWANDLFCFDANVLLNLYRYTPKTRDAFFNVIESMKDRIWISYQAAHEYQKNRLIVIHAQQKAYQGIRETLQKKRGEIDNKLNEFKRHPYLQTEQLKIQIESAFDSINRDLKRLEDSHPNYLDSDPVWERLTRVLENKIGEDFPEDELTKLYSEGKKRYELEIPPGYKDQSSKKNEHPRSLYGDLIMWKQVIAKGKEIEQSIILVTDDLKEDWWYKFEGKTIGPRVELIKEFKDNTKKRINIYRADKFLELANKKLQQELNTEAIEEIRQVRSADLERIRRIQKMNELLQAAQMKSGETDKHWDGEETMDAKTRHVFSYAGISCRIIGTFYLEKNSDRIAAKPRLKFGSDISNFYPNRGLEVYKPSGDSLKQIVNYFEPTNLEHYKEQFGSSIPVQLGKVRYASTNRKNQGIDDVPVIIYPNDLLGQKSALFGMTRTGKSNTTKIIAKAIYELRHPSNPRENKPLRIGQIIFDPNGEYANENIQDKDGNDNPSALKNIWELHAAVDTDKDELRENEVVTYGIQKHE